MSEFKIDYEMEFKNLKAKTKYMEGLLHKWLKVAYRMNCCDPYIELMKDTEIVLEIRNEDGSERGGE